MEYKAVSVVGDVDFLGDDDDDDLVRTPTSNVFQSFLRL